MLSDELSIKVFSLLHLTVAFLFQINPHKPPPPHALLVRILLFLYKVCTSTLYIKPLISFVPL